MSPVKDWQLASHSWAHRLTFLWPCSSCTLILFLLKESSYISKIISFDNWRSNAQKHICSWDCIVGWSISANTLCFITDVLTLFALIESKLSLVYRKVLCLFHSCDNVDLVFRGVHCDSGEWDVEHVIRCCLSPSPAKVGYQVWNFPQFYLG